MPDIKNVIIFDGIKEYPKEEIKKSQELTGLMNSVANLQGFNKMADKINNENGILYIKTDLNHKSGTGSLKNVSTELYQEFWKNRS